MILQIEYVEVFEYIPRHLSNGSIGNGAEDGISELLQSRGCASRESVCEYHHKGSSHEGIGRHNLGIKVIDETLENEWHLNIDQLTIKAINNVHLI